MSTRKHFSDSSSGRLSNLNRVEEEFLVESGDPVTPLRSQLALEYRLQSLCRRLLESYKEQHDWAAVGQVAQSLVTNLQRVSLLKERLLSGNYSLYSSPPRLQSTSELPSESSAHGAQGQPLLSPEAENETQEAVDTGTESGSESESSSVREKKERPPIDIPPQCFDSHDGSADSTVNGSSGASSGVEYETASQQTSEAEPETGTTGSETGTTAESCSQLLTTGTTPSPAHIHTTCPTSSSVGSVNSVDLLEPQEPVSEDLNHTPSNSTAVLEDSSLLTDISSASEGEKEEGLEGCDITSPIEEAKKEELEHTSEEEKRVTEEAEVKAMESNTKEAGGPSVGKSAALAAVEDRDNDFIAESLTQEDVTVREEGGGEEGETRVGNQNGHPKVVEGESGDSKVGEGEGEGGRNRGADKEKSPYSSSGSAFSGEDKVTGETGFTGKLCHESLM